VNRRKINSALFLKTRRLSHINSQLIHKGRTSRKTLFGKLEMDALQKLILAAANAHPELWNRHFVKVERIKIVT